MQDLTKDVVRVDAIPTEDIEKVRVWLFLRHIPAALMCDTLQCTSVEMHFMAHLVLSESPGDALQAAGALTITTAEHKRSPGLCLPF